MKNIMILIGPSGSGKSMIAEFVKNNYNAVEIKSTTTRSPRIGEVDGINYYFKDISEFEELLNNGQLIEHVEYAGNYYGLTKDAVHSALDSSDFIVAVLDKHGAFEIKNMFKNDQNVNVFFVFVHAKLSTLYLRMVNRGDSVEKIAERLQNIMDFDELLQGAFCDFTVFNDGDFSETEKIMRRIIKRFI